MIVVLCIIALCVNSSYQQIAGCRYIADVMFVLDVSDSMTSSNVATQKSFVRDVTRDFHFHPQNGFVVGAIAFSNNLQKISLYPFKNYGTFIRLINNINHDQDGTETYDAIAELRYQFQVYARYNIPRIAVILTDGRSKSRQRTLSEANRAKLTGITIITVGVGVDISSGEMRSMATSPSLVFRISDVTAIRQITYNIANIICRPMTRTTAAVSTVTDTDYPSTFGPITTDNDSNTTTTSTDTTTEVTTARITRSTTRDRTGDPCDGCKYENGIGFMPHERCDKYYHCYKIGVNREYASRECSPGQFWDQTVLTCRPAAQVQCSTDLCHNPNIQHYANPSNCATYWTCQKLRTSMLICCGRGTGYVPNRGGCYPTPFCRSVCNHPVVTTMAPVICHNRPHERDPTHYYTTIFGYVYLMRCAPGTLFSALNCSCSMLSDFTRTTPPKVCTPEVQITFDVDPYDKSKKGVYVRPEGNIIIGYIQGTVGLGSAFFDETSRLIIPRFANDDFGQTFYIKFRYREINRIGQRDATETIVSNSDCDIDCSVSVSLDRLTGRTIGKIVTRNSGTVKISVANFGQWKTVEYRYDGKKFKMTVNGISREAPVTGDITPVQVAFHIGHGCERNSHFVGYVDEFYLYKCLP